MAFNNKRRCCCVPLILFSVVNSIQSCAIPSKFCGATPLKLKDYNCDASYDKHHATSAPIVKFPGADSVSDLTDWMGAGGGGGNLVETSNWSHWHHTDSYIWQTVITDPFIY